MFKLPRTLDTREEISKDNTRANPEWQDLGGGPSKTMLMLAALLALSPFTTSCGIQADGAIRTSPSVPANNKIDAKQVRKMLSDRLDTYEKLPASKLDEEFCSLANMLDGLPRDPENVTLAQNLVLSAQSVTSKPETLQVVGASLENALKSSPISLKASQEMFDYSPYCTLAMLERYENRGVKVSLEQPQYHEAVKYLTRMDKETEQLKLNFIDSNGKKLKDEAFAGRPILINFWAPGCAPCLREMPALNELSLQYGSKVSFLGIATFDEEKRVRNYLSESDKGVSFPVVIQQKGELAVTLGVGTIPASIILDASGHVVWRGSGIRPKERFKEILDSTLTN